MKNETLYNKTVDILLQAYFNDTLRYWDCYACAVGNLVSANMGYKIVNRQWSDNDGNRVGFKWAGVHTISCGEPVICAENYTGLAKEQIDSTGYTFSQTSKIEQAFESGNKRDGDDKMFNGLMAVIDVLDQIHENTDPLATEQTKRKFNKTLHPIK